MNSWGKNCLIIFILETLLLVFLMTPERVTRVMAMEGVKIENSLGTSTMRELDKRASESFNSMFTNKTPKIIRFLSFLSPVHYTLNNISSISVSGTGFER